MTVYAASSVTAFIPPAGVCAGHTLEDKADEDYPYLSINCPVCEPLLVGDPFWASDPEDRPLTRAEEKAAEKLQRELEVEAMISARADREYAHQARLAAEQAAADKPAKPARAPRAKEGDGPAA